MTSATWRWWRCEPHTRRAGGCVLLMLLSLSAGAQTEDLSNPWDDPYCARPALRELMDWVSFQVSFDAGSMVPEMAAGCGSCRAK